MLHWLPVACVCALGPKPGSERGSVVGEAAETHRSLTERFCSHLSLVSLWAASECFTLPLHHVSRNQSRLGPRCDLRRPAIQEEDTDWWAVVCKSDSSARTSGLTESVKWQRSGRLRAEEGGKNNNAERERRREGLKTTLRCLLVSDNKMMVL